MTVGLDEAADTAENDVRQDRGPIAGWWQRAEAFAIDVLLGLATLAILLLIAWSAPRGGGLSWVLLALAAVVLIVVAVNRYVLPASTGWSLGRAVTGIAVVNPDGGPVGPWRLLLRDVAHLADTLPFCLGWLWPLLDARGRTFADRIVGTEVHQVLRTGVHQVLRTGVHQVPGDHPDRRTLAARVIGAVAGLSLLVAGLGFGLVYRHQLAVNRARDTIAADGPTLVTDMLSYPVKPAAADFTRAQGLVTEGYRPELVQQQESVKKNGLVDNTYWVSNSAVLSSTPDRAAMLVLLQGQRGAGAVQRFLTASVRAEYEKHGDRWLVSNLTVLTAPKSAPPDTPVAPDKPAAPDRPAVPDKPGPPPVSGKPAPQKPASPAPSAGGR